MDGWYVLGLAPGKILGWEITTYELEFRDRILPGCFLWEDGRLL